MSNRLTEGDRNIPSSPGFLVGILAIIILLAPMSAWAHGVSVFAYAEGDTVVVEGYFHDGAKCRDCAVEAFDSDGRRLVEGKTDNDGRFSFKAPAATDLLVRLTASMGHRAEYRIPAADLPENLPAMPEAPGEPAERAGAREHTGPAAGFQGAAEIERVVEKVVARQLAPIRRALEESRRQRRLSDIIGGIGYIVGLMGLVLYFRSRRPR